ncbi:MAG: hypothetical protein ABIT71_02355 [Vicinamibacteraceae bacterium]
MSDALDAYLEHPYRSDDSVRAKLAQVRAEEPHVAIWREYGQRARQAGVFAALAAVFPQLRFPIEDGISQEPAYGAATRRGKLEEADAFSPGLLLERPESVILTFSDGVAGLLPLLIAGTRADFESLVRAFTERNEPRDVPPSMGACFVKGLNNWDRVTRYRREWEAANGTAGDDDAWREELGRFAAQKSRYQDRFVILSRGPYSGVAGSEVRVTETEWLERSLIVRAEHESTHDLTWRLFGIVRSHATDEIVADFVGLVRAFGVYPDGIARVLLGVDRLPAFRPGGRLANYRGTPALDDADFAAVCSLAADATRQLAIVAARHSGQLVDPTFLARLVYALSVANLTELADDGLADAVDARL